MVLRKILSRRFLRQLPLPRRMASQGRVIPSNQPRTLLVHGTLILGATAAVFLAGGPEQGSLGIFLCGAGLAMIVFPPCVRIDWQLWAAAGAAVGGSALAFLPTHWFRVPPWRTALEAVPTIPLPVSVSPVPLETGFWLGVLALSMLIGLFALAQPLRTAGLVGVTSLAVLVCAVYTALAIYARQTGWRTPFGAGATFGFLPNRNHTATFLVVGSILTLGLLRVAWRDGRWAIGVLAGGSLALFVAALGFYSASRGGVVFLLIGTMVWAAGLGRRERSVPLLISLGTLLLAGGLLLVASGSEVRNRLWQTEAPTAANAARTDFRAFIYEDTARLIQESPLTGVGLGGFAAVFPQYRQKSLSEANVLHPESDWLMLVAETGLPATLATLTLGWLLWRRTERWRAHSSWPLRWACAVAAGAACLHGLVDVPLHRVALGWWVLAVAAAGMHGGWREGTGRSRAQHALFVAGGIVALTLGTALVRAQWFGTSPLPPFAAQAAREEIDKAIQRQDYAAATRLCERTLPLAPLFEPLYFQKGLLEVQAEADTASDETFRAQRLVDPVLPSIPLAQGQLWINDDPKRTAALWREAFVRAQRINHQAGASREADVSFYRGLVIRAGNRATLARALLDLAGDQTPLVLAWLEGGPAEAVAKQIALLAANDAFVEGLDEAERRRFLAVWYAHGDRAELPGWLDDHPRWRAASWALRLRLLVDGRQYEEAVRAVVARFGIDLALPPVALSSTPLLPSALEATDPVAAFNAYWSAGNERSARRVLGEPAAEHAPTLPAELLRLQIAVAARDADWPRAWQAAEQYLMHTGHGCELAP